MPDVQPESAGGTGTSPTAGEILVSIVVPVGPGDRSWSGLLRDLTAIPKQWEVVVVGTEPPPEDFRARQSELQPRLVRWSVSPVGRAAQLNFGAAQARGRFVWFLHADTRLSAEAIARLQESLDQAPLALHYFRLRFDRSGQRLVKLNEWGANFRATWLGLPFGDQGFCLDRDLFQRAGRFDELAAYGEDHRFVWQCRRCRIPLRRIDVPLVTSPRKYETRGWLRTTGRHLGLTAIQAIREWRRSRRRQPNSAYSTASCSPGSDSSSPEASVGEGPPSNR